jgi:hypothetical protein
MNIIEVIPHPFAIIVAVILMYYHVLNEEKVISFKTLMELIPITYMVDILIIPFFSSDWPATIAFFTEWPTIKAFFTEWPTIEKISQDKNIYLKLIITIIPMFIISWILFKRKSNQQNEKTSKKE